MRIALFVLALLFAATAWADSPAEPRLTVVGTGKVASVPDMATVTLGVTEDAGTAAAALAAASEAAGAIIATLREAGVAEADMQTSEITLQPIWSQSPGTDEGQRITGFQASNAITARIRALDGLGAVLDAVAGAGGNSFRGLAFGLQDPEPAADEARRRAVADALRKARILAEAAGVTLGPVTAIEEADFGSPQPVMMEMAAARMSVPVAEGEVETRAQVRMVFALGE